MPLKRLLPPSPPLPVPAGKRAASALLGIAMLCAAAAPAPAFQRGRVFSGCRWAVSIERSEGKLWVSYGVQDAAEDGHGCSIVRAYRRDGGGKRIVNSVDDGRDGFNASGFEPPRGFCQTITVKADSLDSLTSATPSEKVFRRCF